MKHQIFRVVSFIFTFVMALIIISAIMNRGNTDLMTEMKSADLPLVYTNVEGYYVNQMEGYVSNQKAEYFRQSLTPLPENRKLYLKIDTFGKEVKNISYEVRTVDAKRLIESTQVYDYIVDNNQITADFDIKDLIDRDQEYILVTVLELSDGRTVKYYTRIIWLSESSAESMIRFASDFHTKSFNKDTAKDLSTYLESNAEGDNSTFGKVDIHSNYNQVTWGNLIISDVGEPNITIYEMDSSTSSIVIDSTIIAKEATGDQKHAINEYFRMRAGSERTFLLDYERTMDQYFDPGPDSFAGDAISFGITSENVVTEESKDGNVVLFVQENALYSYNSSTANLSRLFCFYDDDNFDQRTINNKHGIKVISVDETGNTRFLVYGYNCRGRHAGELGISLYYYDIGLNTIQEEVYIPYDKSFSLLKSYINRMSYINRRNELYLYIDETVYRIRVEDKRASAIVENLSDESFVVSESNQLISWKDENDSRKIKLMDLNSSNESEISCGFNQTIMPLGFVGEDLVYGISDTASMQELFDNYVQPPISTIVIQDKNGTIRKEYHQDGIYITNSVIVDKNIKLSRIRVNDEGTAYSEIEDDQITYNSEDEKNENVLVTAITQDYEKVTQINLANNNSKKTVNLQTPGEMLFEGSNKIELKLSDIEDNRYYVYLKGNIEGVYVRPEEAINKASLLAGTAVRDHQEYIWQRGKRKQKITIKNIEEIPIDEESEDIRSDSLSACLECILRHEGVSAGKEYKVENYSDIKPILSKELNADVLELKGCDLNTVLYYIDKGIPVIADVGNEGYVLIIGYDELNTIVFDPKKGTIHKVGMNDSYDWFENNGNKYLTYITKG